MASSTDSEETSTDYSTDSSDEDGMETALVSGSKLQLPQGLCEKKEIFQEFFTVDLWNSFSDEDKQHLQSFLPNFPENDGLEKTKTLQRLFDFDNFWFSNPLMKFFEHLKAGYFRPDIAHMRKLIHKKEKKEAKYRYQTYKKQLKKDVLESQTKLVNQMRNLPPGFEPKQEKRKLNLEEDYLYHRTKRRYFQTLTSIKSKVDEAEFSPDENYPDGPCPQLPRKQKRHLNSIRSSLNNNKLKLIESTMSSKVNGTAIDLEKYITTYHNPFYIHEESYKSVLHQHRKRTLENCGDPEFNTEGISLIDVINRTKLPFNKNLPIKPPQNDANKLVLKKRIKKEIVHRRSTETPIFISKSKNPQFGHPASSNSDSETDSFIDAVTIPLTTNHDLKSSFSPKRIKEEIKKEPNDNLHETNIQNKHASSLNYRETENSINSILPGNYGEIITPIKMEDLETIDIMNTPIELDNSEIDIMGISLEVKPELMQETHANFFSLIRDVICSTNEHRMNMYTLQERLKAWQENPISPLNDWYSYVDNWINILPSAITFLCGNASEQPDDFVPYMEYKMNLDVYQWIGAGRDSDILLSNLCTFWLQHRTESKVTKPIELELDISDRASTPPPPRCPTTWTVRKATNEEIKEYQDQERKRYDNPHKAFTFRCNGYESVVGPLKGVYYPAPANSKARGHTMLNADRPNFVTILSLVRDATARLPNGEGTRSDICELLKSSQYISNSAPDNILQSVVSGALDRMHTQWDPCVKYDQKRKIWIYLHRHRTEDDFERIHQHYQGVQKVKKATRKSPAKPKIPKGDKPVKVAKQQQHKILTTVNATMVVSPNMHSSHPVFSPQSIPSPVEAARTLKVIKEEIKEDSLEDSQENSDIMDQMAATPHDIVAVAVAPQKTTPLRRKSHFQQPKKSADSVEEKLLVVTSAANLITTQKGTSLLLSNNPPKQSLENPSSIPTKLQSSHFTKRDSLDDETPELVQIRVSSPLGVLKGTNKGSMVKIVSPSHGKSVIIPTSNPQILKQIQERSTKVPVSHHQFLHSLAVQGGKQKTVTTKGTIALPEGEKFLEKTKIPVNIQQQIVQGLTTQQLQNIKNVTLLRTANHNSASAIGVQTSVESQESGINVIPKVSQSEGIHVKSSTNLTSAQTHQIFQSLKQKYLPNANILTPQQQVLLKQKGCVVQLQKSASSSAKDGNKLLANNQVPMVAKVLTNAAGQVISVESLLAHQKTHGTLPQGTTLRVQGTKPGQQNLIHLTSTTKPNAVAHFTVGTQNNLVPLTTQPKLVVASPTTSAATTVTQARSHSRGVATSRAQQSLSKSSNITQHIVNAKLITADGQKIVQPKLMMGQHQAIKVPTKSGTRTASFGSSLRMLNTGNLNLTTLDGKPVLLASKSGIQGLHGQNVLVQAHPNSIPTSSSLVLQSAVTKKGSNQSQNASSLLNQSGNIVFSSTAIKNQVPQQMLFSSQTKNVSTTQGHLVLGNQPIRLQTNSNSGGSQRVVLASQGQGGQILTQQILIPAALQGTTINIKSLQGIQGVKVIPIAQNQKGQSRQIVAKVMSPSVMKQTSSQSASSVQLQQESVTIHSSESE